MNFNFFNKENSVAQPGFTRWLVPPAALSIHLCIGQIYAYSVFNKPMTQLIGINQATNDDWDLKTLGWIFSIALFCLGASAAVLGKWVEKSGPRKSMFASAICFTGGFLVAATGIHFHTIWLVYLGNGVLGGIGLGLGYISPVSTLIKWFPDKPGMATGMAIMGFGGGAIIASPLSVWLMNQFRSADSMGVEETFIILGCIYFIVMLYGVISVRIPPPNWKPEGFEATQIQSGTLISRSNVLADNAIKTPQFYLLFGVLMLNVTAGIGVLGQASVMIQEMFSVTSVGAEYAISEKAAAGFVMLLSIFNMLGRFFWSSLSDTIGRKNTYFIFFILGAVLYLVVPTAGKTGNIYFFIATLGIIISMYGGGFATIPAYLRDLFGTVQVGAIHGRLLLAWSAAALLGPVLINYIRNYQIEVRHIPKADAYSFTLYLMAGLLVIGMVLNWLVKPVEEKFHEKP